MEDDEEMAHYNARLLTRKGYELLVAHNLAEARAHVIENTPDLFIFDVELPDGSGLSLCREFRKKSNTPILFLTGRAEVTDKITGLNAGGDYYLTKPYDKSEFLAVVQSLIRRAEWTLEQINESSVISKGSLVLKVDERKAYVKSRDAGLSPREFAVLLMLVQNEEKEITYKELYEGALGMEMLNNDTSVLRMLMSRLRKKLDENNASDFSIFNNYGESYMFSGV
jgi:DNA-binding response OmpR family regulator